MPLPQALAAKLAKRGIIKLPTQQPKETAPAVEPEVVTAQVQEEIIAEDYDDTPQQQQEVLIPPPEQETIQKFQGWFSCPNKWNVYHECSQSCKAQWSKPKEVDGEYNQRRMKMLLKYPLINHWQEVLDVGIGRYYYWNMETNLVSWLPPGHPKCQVSRSAADLRKQMMLEREERVKEEKKGKGSAGEESSDEEIEYKEKKKIRRRSSIEDELSSDSSSESMEEGQPKERKRIREKREKERERDRGRDRDRDRRGKDRDRRGKRRKDDDSLDPMDPAAYSECPRGTWASGLPERNEARTGVDTTATGPLFQMRPYPNPGAVLRANSAANSSVGPKKPS